MLNQILIVDDDKWFCQSVEKLLLKNGYKIDTVYSGKQAMNHLEITQPDIILLDIILPDIDGFSVCQHIKTQLHLKNIPILFVTSSDDREIVAKCFHVGAADYIGKPIREYELLARIELLLNIGKQKEVIREIQSENIALSNRLLSGQLENPDAFAEIITCNSTMQSIFKYIEAIASSSRPVLITGETGVGKEMIAKTIHELSNRQSQIVTVNVGSLDDNLFSDTLFGHAKGAFTGADKERSGLIEKAAGGTLFLDEIGDLKPESQVKLLRLLQEQEYYPLGSDERKLSDARIIVATNCDLSTQMQKGLFRSDLFYRLKTHHIHIPPLRERREDICLLFNHFLSLAAKELKRKKPLIPQPLLPLLECYSFPGNIRELESLIFDAISRSSAKSLSLDVFRAYIPESEQEGLPHSQAQSNQNFWEFAIKGNFPSLKTMNDMLIQRAMEHANGNQSVAAKLLGISRQALNKRLNRISR